MARTVSNPASPNNKNNSNPNSKPKTKLTVLISEQTSDKLREYVTSKYPRAPYGKLSEVVEKAITEYLEKNP